MLRGDVRLFEIFVGLDVCLGSRYDDAFRRSMLWEEALSGGISRRLEMEVVVWKLWDQVHAKEELARNSHTGSSLMSP